jgi:hypothetical protein
VSSGFAGGRPAKPPSAVLTLICRRPRTVQWGFVRENLRRGANRLVARFRLRRGGADALRHLRSRGTTSLSPSLRRDASRRRFGIEHRPNESPTGQFACRFGTSSRRRKPSFPCRRSGRRLVSCFGSFFRQPKRFQPCRPLNDGATRGLIVRHGLGARLSLSFLSFELCFGLNPSLLFVRSSGQDHLPFAELLPLGVCTYIAA